MMRLSGMKPYGCPSFFFLSFFFFTPRDENRADRPNGKSHQARGRLLSSGRALQQPPEQKNDINTYNGRNPSRPLIPNTTKKKLIELLFQAALSFFPSSITLSGFFFYKIPNFVSWMERRRALLPLFLVPSFHFAARKRRTAAYFPLASPLNLT